MKHTPFVDIGRSRAYLSHYKSIVCLFVITITPLSLCSFSYAQTHQDTANVYLGTLEIGSNSGPDVERFLSAVGLNNGFAWCSAFVSFSLDAPDVRPTAPVIRSALAQDYITSNSIKATDVLIGKYKPVRGTIVVWKKGAGPYGHVGLVLVWKGACGYTIEGNTSRGMYGSQSDGDGVFVRWRCITPGSHFRITNFTPVIYDD